MALYEKQYLQWRKAHDAKLDRRREEILAEEHAATFSPTFFTAAPVEGLDEQATEIVRNSGQSHINRQLKSRKMKEDQQSKLMWKQKQKQTTLRPRSTSPPSSHLDTTSFSLGPKFREFSDISESGDDTGNGPSRSARQIPDTQEQTSGLEQYPDDGDLLKQEESLFLESEDDPIVEVLERERRQWHAERVKLIHCIHMQQLELAQRSAAAQDKAVEISQAFDQTIQNFEERLVHMETNVQKELMAIKAIADSLQQTAEVLKAAVRQKS